MELSFYKDALTNIPLGYGLHKIILDDCGQPCDYQFVEVNKEFEKALGIKAAEIVGRRVTECFPDIINDHFNWIDSCGNVALNGTTLDIEQFSKELGKWYRINIYSPERYYFITILSDITREKSEYKFAYDSEMELKHHLDSIPLGIVVVNNKAKLIEVNPEGCKISGYTAAELTGISIQRLVASSSRIIGLMFFKDVLMLGHAECQLQMKNKFGKSLWLDVTGRMTTDNRYTFYFQDITAYKEMEDDLVESELLYRTFINASEDMIYLKDENLQYIIVNDTLLDEYGVEYSEIIGKSDHDLQPEPFFDKTKASDLEVLKTKMSSVSDETFFDNKSFEAFKFPVPIGNKKTGVGAYIRDVTEKKKQEEMLKRTMERHRILASALLMTFTSTQEQLDYALHEALTLTGSKYGYIFKYDDELQEMTLNCWTNGVLAACALPEFKDVYKLEDTGLWGEVIRQRAPIIVNDIEKPNPLMKGYPEGHVKIKNFMSIPVILNNRVVAAVGLANKESDYDNFDVDELTMLMTGVWVSVEKKNVQSKMENLLEQTQAMFNEHDAVMLLHDPDSGLIIDANPAAVSFYGYTKDELLALNINDIALTTTEDKGELYHEVDNKKHKYFSFPHLLKSGDKRIVDVYSCPITHNNGKVIFSIIFDVTEREEAFDEIKYLSFHDHLTGLYNRRYFDNVLKLMNDERFLPLTIVMADVNGLKLVNDSFGHAEGDELLAKAAEVIFESCRKDDVSARIGGDEFVIILPNTDEHEAGKIVKRIKKLQSKINIRQLNLSMSFGYAVKHDVASDVELIVSEAENKMYKNKMLESASTRNKTVSIILNTLYEKCKGELDHSNRVSKIAVAIATEMGCDADQVTQVGVAGLLHDIGKIGIDESVLNKQGVYSPSDREEIEKHAESGWRILSNSDEYSGLADYVLYHHETVDGKGYPRGLKGNVIPLESKIISVSEAYDAMISIKPYRKALSKEEIIEEFRKASGSQFDTDVVNVFIDKVLNAGSKYNF